MTDVHHTDAEHPPPEDDDTPGGPVLLVLTATVLLGVLMVIWAGVLLSSEREILGVVPAPEPVRAPRTIGFLEQTLVLEDRYGLRLVQAQREALDDYAWADREAGLVRVPIERAMDLVAAGVLPVDVPPEVPLPDPVDPEPAPTDPDAPRKSPEAPPEEETP